MKTNLFLRTLPYIIILLFGPCTLSAFAQQTLSQFRLRISKPNQAYIATDSSGNIACVFQNHKEYEVDFLSSADYTVLGTAIAEKVKIDKGQKIIGALLEPEYCYAYFYNKKLKTISCLEVKKTDGGARYLRVRTLQPNEQFLRAFEMNGRFYVLTVPKMNSAIKVLAFSRFDVQETEYPISDMPTLYAELSNHNNDLNAEAESEVGIEVISYNMENNIKSSYPLKKLYHFDNKIILSFDHPGYTDLITLDLDAQKADYKKLNFSLEKGNDSQQKQGNSFLYRNRFFRSTISAAQLNITILDLDSMNLINSYNFFPGENISILNGPIVQEGGTPNNVQEERIIKKSEQFFRRVLNGSLAITANHIGDKYEIEVGAYDEYTTMRYPYGGYGGYGGWGGPTISMGMGMGGIGIGNMGYYPSYYTPGYYGWPGYYNSQPSTRLRVVYFKSLLNADDFSHISGNVPTTMNEKINEYESNVFRFNQPDVIRLAPYRSDGSMLLGYYQRNGRRFFLTEFRK